MVVSPISEHVVTNGTMGKEAEYCLRSTVPEQAPAVPDAYSSVLPVPVGTNLLEQLDAV